MDHTQWEIKLYRTQWEMELHTYLKSIGSHDPRAHSLLADYVKGDWRLVTIENRRMSYWGPCSACGNLIKSRSVATVVKWPAPRDNMFLTVHSNWLHSFTLTWARASDDDFAGRQRLDQIHQLLKYPQQADQIICGPSSPPHPNIPESSTSQLNAGAPEFYPGSQSAQPSDRPQDPPVSEVPTDPEPLIIWRQSIWQDAPSPSALSLARPSGDGNTQRAQGQAQQSRFMDFFPQEDRS